MPADPDENLSSRLSLCLPTELFRQLDRMVAERGVGNRSQMMADLIRRELARHGARRPPDEAVAGTMTLVYQAESGEVSHAVALTQGDYPDEVIASQHVFLEDDQSLEVLLVQGPAGRLDALGDALRSVRGVQQLRLVATTALLPPLHGGGGAPRPMGRIQ